MSSTLHTKEMVKNELATLLELMQTQLHRDFGAIGEVRCPPPDLIAEDACFVDEDVLNKKSRCLDRLSVLERRVQAPASIEHHKRNILPQRIHRTATGRYNHETNVRAPRTTNQPSTKEKTVAPCLYIQPPPTPRPTSTEKSKESREQKQRTLYLMNVHPMNAQQAWMKRRWGGFVTHQG